MSKRTITLRDGTSYPTKLDFIRACGLALTSKITMPVDVLAVRHGIQSSTWLTHEERVRLELGRRQGRTPIKIVLRTGIEFESVTEFANAIGLDANNVARMIRRGVDPNIIAGSKGALAIKPLARKR